MDGEKFRQLFDYHFEFNRRLLDYCAESLTNEQFTEDLAYSHGSVRNLLVHIMSVDERWFSGLLGSAPPDSLDASTFTTSDSIVEKWKNIEGNMRTYLKDLRDTELDDVFTGDLMKWQVLFHVVNHGTHHRAQLFSMLERLGIKSYPQDYALYILGRI